MVGSTQVFCGWARTRTIKAIALAGLKEVGSSKDTQVCCCHSRAIMIQSMTQSINVIVKKLSDHEVRAFVTNLSGVIVAHTARAGV